MLVIKRQFPLDLRPVLGVTVFVAGFVGASSLLHTYVPRSNIQTDVVSTPRDSNETDVTVPVTPPPANEPTSVQEPSYVRSYQSTLQKVQTPIAPSPVTAAEPAPVVTPTEEPPVVEQPAQQPPEETPPPEEPIDPAP